MWRTHARDNVCRTRELTYVIGCAMHIRIFQSSQTEGLYMGYLLKQWCAGDLDLQKKKKIPDMWQL